MRSVRDTGSAQCGQSPPRPTRVQGRLHAVVAPLLAVVAGFAGWAGVDRDVASSDRLWDNGFGVFGRGGVAAGPGGLAARLGAVALATTLVKGVQQTGQSSWLGSVLGFEAGCVVAVLSSSHGVSAMVGRRSKGLGAGVVVT